MGLLRLAQLLEELVAAPDELALQCLFPLLGMLAHAADMYFQVQLLPLALEGRNGRVKERWCEEGPDIAGRTSPIVQTVTRGR